MTYRIVVGVDGSKHSRAALLWALDEAQCHSGEVTALFAWQVPFLSFPGAFDREELEQASKDSWSRPSARSSRPRRCRCA
jgi:nucleotide-binding universal stress UspA family protein